MENEKAKKIQNGTKNRNYKINPLRFVIVMTITVMVITVTIIMLSYKTKDVPKTSIRGYEKL